jgi:hypothetical protein
MLVPDAVAQVLRLAATWLAWDGGPRHVDGNVWTPHKALRRVTDHLLDHLAEIDAVLADAPTVPDTWHGRTVTLDADWARFTEVDLDEARSRLAATPSSTGSGSPPCPRPSSTGPARPRGRSVKSRTTSPRSSTTRGRLATSAPVSSDHRRL